jgi:hypothetical protein
MNYYPNNYYLNYPYGNQYQQQQPMPYQAQTQTPQPQGLNGKIVDSQDVVRATEVPIGGYGIFPKADLSEIYIKSWNNNGTTSVITYKPESPQVVATTDPIAELKEQINMINSKLDSILAAAPVKEVKTEVKTQTPAPAPKKEVFF